MDTQIFWILDLTIQPNKLIEFTELKREMIANVTASEPNTLTYDWFISDDQQTCHLYERYSDSDAVMTHLGAFFEKYAERFFASTTVNRMVVYGSISDEVRQALQAAGAEFMVAWS